MKRVIKPEKSYATAQCEKYSLNVEKFLKDAEEYNIRHDLRNLVYALERAHDHLRILGSWIKKLSDSKEISYYSELRDDFQNTYAEIESNLKESMAWSKLSGSEQYAVEIAKRLISEGYTVEDAAYKACDEVSYGNAEPEYIDEEFYQEEPDERKVIEYLRGTF